MNKGELEYMLGIAMRHISDKKLTIEMIKWLEDDPARKAYFIEMIHAFQKEQYGPGTDKDDYVDVKVDIYEELVHDFCDGIEHARDRVKWRITLGPSFRRHEALSRANKEQHSSDGAQHVQVTGDKASCKQKKCCSDL